MNYKGQKKTKLFINGKVKCSINHEIDLRSYYPALTDSMMNTVSITYLCFIFWTIQYMFTLAAGIDAKILTLEQNTYIRLLNKLWR